MNVIQGGQNVNQLSQQSGNYQGQQGQHGYQDQNTQFQPIGYVQSHYQGQLSQPTFGRQSNSIVSNQPGGYQASNQGNMGTQHYANNANNGYGTSSQSSGSYNSYNSHQPVHSYAQSPATAFGDVGPVIAHYGYQASPNSQQSYYQPSSSNQGSQYGQQNMSNYGGNAQNASYNSHFNSQNGYSQSNSNNGYGGMTPTHSNTSLHPVYEATNAYQQAGPVISHYGWQANSAVGSPYNNGGQR